MENSKLEKHQQFHILVPVVSVAVRVIIHVSLHRVREAFGIFFF